jgi:hypothetical protein
MSEKPSLPHFVEGPMAEAKAAFYELAKSQVKYVSEAEIKAVVHAEGGRSIWRRAPRDVAIFIMNTKERPGLDGDDTDYKWIESLDILVNKDALSIQGEDFSDIAPFIIEHEIFEGWLSAKKGTGPDLSVDQKHRLARRREAAMAVEHGKAERLLKYTQLVNPMLTKEYRQALRLAQQKRARRT